MKSIQSLHVLIWKYFMTYFSNEKGKFWKGLYNIIEYLQNIHINQCFPTTNFVCVIGGSLIQTWVSESPQLGLLFLSVLLYASVSLLHIYRGCHFRSRLSRCTCLAFSLFCCDGLRVDPHGMIHSQLNPLSEDLRDDLCPA